MEESSQHTISKKLDILIKLTAMDAVRGREFREQVRILSQAGFRPKDIAELLDKSPGNVNTTLSIIRKGNNRYKGDENE